MFMILTYLGRIRHSLRSPSQLLVRQKFNEASSKVNLYSTKYLRTLIDAFKLLVKSDFRLKKQILKSIIICNHLLHGLGLARGNMRQKRKKKVVTALFSLRSK